MRRAKRLVAFLFIPLVTAPSCSDVVTSEDWQKDLRELERQLAERHVNLFHTVSKSAFEEAVLNLEQRIPSLTPPELLVGFAQLVANGWRWAHLPFPG